LAAKDLLPSANVDQIQAVTILAFRLHQIRQMQLQSLQIDSPNAQIDKDVYGTAVVNIFARLNQGGTTLTKEEITYAWINQTWPEAHVMFDQLLSNLPDTDKKIGKDEIIRGANIIYVALTPQAVLLNERQLLGSRELDDFIKWIKDNWQKVESAIVIPLNHLHKHGVSLGSHLMSSINSFWLIAAWWANEWNARNPTNVAEETNLRNDMCNKVVADGIRWLYVSHLSSIWRQDTGKTMRSILARNLGKNLLTQLTSENLENAIDELKDLTADRQSISSAYYFSLWIWNHLDATRKTQFMKQLRAGAVATALHVDHLVAFENDIQDPNGELKKVINEIGNMALCDAPMNIAKGNRPLSQFMNVAIADELARSTWYKAFAIPDLMARADGQKGEEIQQAISERSRSIKDDISKYLNAELKLI
jgi:hypothetical protein